MLLQRAFTPSVIKVDLESETKEELFEEMVDMLARAAGAAFPRREILDALERREAKMSTGIYKGIALPHATVESLGSMRGALGISRKGIDYDSLDGNPVYIVFLLLTPPSDAEIHLQTLQALAGLAADKQAIQKLSSSGSSEEAFTILKNFEASAPR